FSNVPCNGYGTCNLYVYGLSYTVRYQWRVVAKLAGWVAPGGGSNLYTTSSSTFHFSTTWDLSIPVRNITTQTGNYLRAVGGGGGAFDAAGTANNYETQFQFVDY